jgi:hypothetical protein
MKLTSQMPSSTSLMPEHGRDIDLFPVHADAAACGDQDVAVMPGILEFRQPVIRPWRGGVEPRGPYPRPRICANDWQLFLQFD